jgi:hypothetical protein
MSKKRNLEEQVTVSRVLMNHAYERYKEQGPNGHIDPHRRYDRNQRDDKNAEVIREYYSMGTALYRDL